MSDRSYMQLKTSCINNVPLQAYDEFTFIVNGEEYKTSRIISDLLSPKICQNHLNDPTFNQYTIKTKHQGNFTRILNLVNFEKQIQPENDYDFIMEVLENLCNESIEFSFQDSTYKLTNKNALKLLRKHEKYPYFFSTKIDAEIDFISSHFHELFEDPEQYKKLQQFELDTIEQIIDNNNLKLNDEDQLLAVINKLYSIDSKYATLYEYVDFKAVGKKSIKEFINIFDINDLSSKMWQILSKRLDKDINTRSTKRENKRYITKEQSKNYTKNSTKYQARAPKNDDPFGPPNDYYRDPFTFPIPVPEDPFANIANESRNNNDPFADITNDLRNRNDPFANTTDESSNRNDPFAVINRRDNNDDPFY